jgi:hypothetical protein
MTATSSSARSAAAESAAACTPEATPARRAWAALKVWRLTATGALANHAIFRTQLANEAREIENDVDSFKIYPILQLGLG